MRNFIRGAFWFCFLIIFISLVVIYFSAQGMCSECHRPAAGIFFDMNNKMYVLCREHAIVYLQTEQSAISK